MKIAAVYQGGGREYHTSGEAVASDLEAAQRHEFHMKNGAIRTYLIPASSEESAARSCYNLPA